LSLDAVSARTGIDIDSIEAVEAGWRLIGEDEIELLAVTYGVEADSLVPPRTPVEVDRAARTLRVGEHEVSFAGADVDPLSSYLTMIYALRDAPRGSRIPLRDEDLDALSALVGDDPVDIESRLIELMGCTRTEAKSLRVILLRRRVLASAAGLVLGLTVAGTGFADAAVVVPTIHVSLASLAAAPSSFDDVRESAADAPAFAEQERSLRRAP
jgi:hypothetical protein